MKKIVLAGIVASLVMFALAGLYSGVIARSFIASHVDPGLVRAPANLVLVYAGYLSLGLVMAWLYPRFKSGVITPWRSGAAFGLVTAIVWLMPYSLVLFGVYRFPYEALPLDFAWALVEQGTGGVVVGLVYGKTAVGA